MATHHNTLSSPIVPGDLFARHQTITGLRALADFLETNPAVPVSEYGQTFYVSTRELDDASAVAAVDQIAALLDVDVCDETDQGGHYTAQKSFGRISYRILHIPRHVSDTYDARDSYRSNIVLDDTPDRDSDTSERAA
ncbi:hypothetical protein GCM10010182_04230 [Actinomadura cremea]|nr:hypothetical protein GCM10010182_04230 [Actinomadura cremea]